MIRCQILSDFLTKNETIQTGRPKLIQQIISQQKNLEIMHHLIKATAKNADKKHIPGVYISP